MVGENLQVARRIFDRWATGDLSAGAAELDPDVVFIVRPPFPEFACVAGPDAIDEYMSRFLSGWRRYSIEAKRLRPVGDTVLVDAIQRGEGKASGVEVEVSFFMLLTFRRGRIVRIESVLDEIDALGSQPAASGTRRASN